MTVIDTHSHIYLAEFNADRGAMLERAAEQQINQILMPAIDSATHEDMLSLENQYPAICKSMMGLHPCSVKANYQEELEQVRQWLEKRPFVAVGEIGLDFYWDKTFTKEQYDAFEKQLQWSIDFDLPVSIHSRSATDECIEVVTKFQRKIKGVFHCFSGDLKQAKQIIDLGMYLGIGGVVSFKNAGLDVVVRDISLDHIVLETDAPYLAPVPFRGKRNEPGYLRYVIEKLAIIKSIEEADVRRVTSENAKKIFGLN